MTDAADIRQGDWIDRLLPAALRPYCRLARLDRPIGTWLLLFPCWWSVALASDPKAWPDWGLMGLFALGALVMRGAGCTINDIIDRDIDAKVARTATRPLASGAISLKQAIVFLAAQLAVGLAVLFAMQPLAIGLGVASLALVGVYPLMKRVTWWPQAFLGLTFNWGALLGWAAVRNDLSWPSVLLYAAGFFWTLSYDTIYAHQDKADDRSIGVRSTALLFGEGTRRWLIGFDAAMLALLAICFSNAELGAWAYVSLVPVGAHLAWQALAFDMDRPADCLAKFKSNRWVGWMVLIGIVLGRAWN